MNWGDELCGVPVTPQSWAGGGVIELTANCVYNATSCSKEKYDESGEVGQWLYPAFLDRIFATHSRPIFPPRGWAGRTDAELWEAVNGGAGLLEVAAIGTRKGCIEVDVSSLGNIGVEVSDGYTTIYESTRDSGQTAALILALQNAQVLATRLLEANHGD